MDNEHRQLIRRGAVASFSAITVIAVSACGSSSSTQSNAAAVAAKSGATSASNLRPGAGRFAALRECLAKNGITLPQRPQGAHRPGAGSLLGSGERHFSLPQGVNREKYEAALKKCGGSKLRPGGDFAARIGQNPQAGAAFTTFAACMRTHGIKLPAPNLSGKGSIFDTTGLNTKSSAFQSAYAACRSDLHAGFAPTGSSGTVPRNK